MVLRSEERFLPLLEVASDCATLARIGLGGRQLPELCAGVLTDCRAHFDLRWLALKARAVGRSAGRSVWRVS